MSPSRRPFPVQGTAHQRVLAFLRDNGSSGASAATVGVLTGGGAIRAGRVLDGLVRRKQAVCWDGLYYAVPTEPEAGGVDL
ncbi:hypothetical protein ABTX71_02120 [Streptomyces parvulus]|uniref:hypothetical protein n=1 Tax=Streptomyces parvulus TaxID=146923 RepID=UPI003326B37D